MKSILLVLMAILLCETCVIALFPGHAPIVEPILPDGALLDGIPAPVLRQHYAESLQRFHASKDPSDLLILADLLACYGRHVSAIPLYRYIASKNVPASQDAWLGLAICLDSIGDAEGAISAYRRSVSDEDDMPFSLNCRHRIGELLQILGRTSAAETQYRTSLRHPLSRCLLIRRLLHQGDRSGASAEFTDLISNLEICTAAEVQQLNDLSFRLYGEILVPLPPVADRRLAFTEKPVDQFQKLVEERHGMPVAQLFHMQFADIFRSASSTGQADASPSGLQDTSDAQAIARGRLAYETNACLACHGADGRGGLGPNLLDDHWIIEATPEAIFTTIANGRPGTCMPGYRTRLDAHQMSDLTTFIIDRNLRADRSLMPAIHGAAPQGPRRPLQPLRTNVTPAAAPSPAGGSPTR